jgi:uncharacterized membrane protein YozB (DUF420 family)
MYTVVLIIHNILRWVVLILAVYSILRAYSGWFGKREWRQSDRKAGSFFTIAMDVQLLVGLWLYIFLSPLTETALGDFGAAMNNAELRFFALEHVLYMVLAVVFAHLGNVLSRRAEEMVAKYRRAALWFTLTLIFIVIAIPWSRPLLRF